MAKHGPLFPLFLTLAAGLVARSASAGTWQAVGVGDCPGRDVAGSRGTKPDPARCDANFAGNTAVCWATGCTYKSVATPACTGGANPGQMYTCAASTAAPPAAPAAGGGTWQLVGVGDCPGRDVSGSAGAKPDGAKCNASFAGNTAVCWASGCTYKDVATAACTGGANPGQMYTCQVAGAAPAAPPPSVGGWQPMGVGDCPGRDVAGSRGPVPEPGRCDANFAGFTAVCWANGCTYKNVLTGQCIGGANPGQMYTCGAPGAAGGAGPLPPRLPPATPKASGRKYSVINYTGDKQNPHDFLVDWKACKVVELGQDLARGPEEVTVEVCRPGSRLIIKTEFKSTGYFVHYDWILLDNGTTLAGAYCDQSTCGPSAGKRK
jgi:hypothetical protein